MTVKKSFSTNIMESLRYDHVAGLFFWNSCAKPFVRHGHKPAGSTNKNGYIYISFNRKKHLAHRLAFMFMDGHLPQKSLDVDHINHVRDDNRWSNLRCCDRANNLANSNVSSGELPRGVQGNGKHGFMARIRRKGKVIYIGTFQSPEAASEAYKSKRQELVGEFQIGGRYDS